MKLKLSTEGTEQVKVLAVVSCEPLYKVAWLLNQQFGWSLAEAEVLSVINKEHTDIQQFVVFAWSNAESGTNYYLIQNKGTRGALEPAMRTVDYWLRIENGDDAGNVAQEIKKIDGIQIVQEIAPADLKKNSPVFRTPLYQSNL